MTTSGVKQIILAKRPDPGCAVTPDCFQVQEAAAAQENNNTANNIIKVKPLYFSVDPYLRSQFDSNTGVDYVKPFTVGEPLSSFAVGKVVEVPQPTTATTAAAAGENSSSSLQVGDYVMSEGMSGWPWREQLTFTADTAENTDDGKLLLLSAKTQLRQLPRGVFDDDTVSHMLGAFGATGLTAFFGILREAHPLLTPKSKHSDDDVDDDDDKEEGGATKNDEKQYCVVVISSAAGGTGVIASQLAKRHVRQNTWVVGISGSDEKNAALLQLGAVDAVVNYKKQQTSAAADDDAGDSIKKQLLTAIGGRSVDVFFDCVGGTTAAAVHELMSEDGVSVLVGQSSTYNDAKSETEEYPPPLPAAELALLKAKRVRRERYLVLKYQAEFEAALGELLQMVLKEKTLVPVQTVFDKHGVEHIGEAFCAMMAGKNLGKMVVKM